MATEITDHDQHPSPGHDDQGNGNGAIASEANRGVKRPRPNKDMDEDEDDDEKTGRERRKIEIKFIQDKSRRHITFSKRKAGIMKKVRPPRRGPAVARAPINCARRTASPDSHPVGIAS